MPDGASLTVKHKGTLPLPSVVNPLAGEVSIVPHLQSVSLLSVGQFTDHGCTAEMSYNFARIKKAQQTILHGYRNFKDDLWDITLPWATSSLPNQKINAIIKLDKNESELANFLHECLFSPCPSTLIRAIWNNHFLSWPGIKEIDFHQYVKENVAMQKGHFNQEQKILLSTIEIPPDSSPSCHFPTDTPLPKCHVMISGLFTHQPKKSL